MNAVIFFGILIGIILMVVFFASELATLLVLGNPFLSAEKADFIRALLSDAELNSMDPKMLSLKGMGYISSSGNSLFGTLYYSDCDKVTIRIPWWSPLYKEVKATYKKLYLKEISV